MNIRSLRGLAAICCSILVCLITNSAQAVVIEGFESASIVQGTNAKGDASIQGIYFTINPTQLTKQLLLTTIGAADVGAGYSSQSGTNAVAVGTPSTGLAAFFGISTGTINNGVGVNGTEGSGFKESFALTAGDVLSFNYDFMTQEPPTGGAKDFAFVVLLNSLNQVVQYSVFSNYAAATLGTTGVGNPFGNETGYLSFQLNIPTTGTYTLGFGVVDTGNAATDTNPSGLLIDNIQVTAIPEPTTIGFSVAGAALLVALRKRIKKTS